MPANLKFSQKILLAASLVTIVAFTLFVLFNDYRQRQALNADVHAALQEVGDLATRNQAWSAALARYALAQNPANHGALEQWASAWQPLADRAVEALAVVFADAPAPLDVDAVRNRVSASVRALTDSWSS